MNNKKVMLFATIFFTAILLTTFVSAQTQTRSLADLVQNTISGIAQVLAPILTLLLGSGGGAMDSDILIGKILIVIIVFSIAWLALKKSMQTFFTDHAWALWVISLAVSILGVRFLTPELIQTIIIPNSAFAVAISAGLPFVLFFFVVLNLPVGVVRRISWIFFAVIFLALYTTRIDALGDVSYIYPLTALLAFAMAIFDGTIQKFFLKLRMQKARIAIHGGQVGILEKKLLDIHAKYLLHEEQNSVQYYQGVSPGNVGPSKIGEAAYYTDVNYYEKRIRQFLSKM